MTQDWHWNNYFDVIIGPHPDLTESQKQVVGKDYGFDHGKGDAVACAMRCCSTFSSALACLGTQQSLALALNTLSR